MTVKLKYFAIEDEIYHKSFHLFVDIPKEAFKNWLSEVHKQDISEDLRNRFKDAKAMMLWGYSPLYYLWIEEFNWSIKHQCVLIHEISHHVDWVLNNAGIPLDWENSEVRAYYLEYLVKKVYDKLRVFHREV